MSKIDINGTGLAIQLPISRTIADDGVWESGGTIELRMGHRGDKPILTCSIGVTYALDAGEEVYKRFTSSAVAHADEVSELVEKVVTLYVDDTPHLSDNYVDALVEEAMEALS